MKDFEECLEMGMDWTLREGYCWAEDKEHCEEYGRMLTADASKVSVKAKKRGLPQVNKYINDGVFFIFCLVGNTWCRKSLWRSTSC